MAQHSMEMGPQAREWQPENETMQARTDSGMGSCVWEIENETTVAGEED